MPRILIFSGGLLFLLTLLLPNAQAQPQRGDTFPRLSPNAMVSQQVGVTHVRLAYSRPGVREREIFGGLVPYGEVWRTGANEATTITFSEAVEVEGRPLAAGTYGLFTVPGPEAWTVIFNDTEEQWGAFTYDEGGDVLRVEVTPRPAPPQEQMTFLFEDVTDTSATLVLRWAETAVPVRLTTDTDAVLRARAEALDASDYEDLVLKAQLLARAGDRAAALEAAQQAVQQAEAMSEPPQNLEQLKEQIQAWQEQQ